MERRDRPEARKMHPLTPVVGVVTAGVAMFAFAGSSGAAVASVSGGAFGEQVNVQIVDVGPITDGPTPTVTLPSTGGSAMQSAASESAGPAGLFLTSGALNVTTQGTTGATGSVTSAASVLTPNVVQTFQAAAVASQCSATEAGVTGATTITNGTLVQSAANPNMALPTSPAPNTSIDGVNDVEGGTGDLFTIILNQQTTSGGVLTVNAVVFVLRGPTATGNIILGQSRCGVSAAATTTTRAGVTTTTTAVAGVTTTRPPTTGNADLARTGTDAPLLPALAVVIAALGASRWARRRPDVS